MLRAGTVCVLAMALSIPGCARRRTHDHAATPPTANATAASETSIPTPLPVSSTPPSPDDTELVAEPVPLEPALPELAPKTPLDLLAGDFRFTGGGTQRAAVTKAIGDVADKMGLLVRAVAKRRLMEANEIPTHVAISHEGSRVTVVLGRVPYIATLGGKPVKVRDPTGKRSRLHYEMKGNSLVQVFDGAEGDRINTFTPREDGKGIVMAVTMRSPQLPDDVRYRLWFRTQ